MEHNYFFNRYLVDQFLDDPKIRKEFEKTNTPEEVLRVFKTHGISFDPQSAQALYTYIHEVLNRPEVKQAADRFIRL